MASRTTSAAALCRVIRLTCRAALGAAVQREGAGGEHEHGVPVGQGVAGVQGPRQSGVRGGRRALALGLVQDGVGR